MLSSVATCFRGSLFVCRRTRLDVRPKTGFTSLRSYKSLSKQDRNRIVGPNLTLGVNPCGRHVLRNESSNQSKSKTVLKTVSQLKLAQLMSKCPIETFPLFKDNFDENGFQEELSPLLDSLKLCQQNQLNNPMYYPSVTTILSSTLPIQSVIALDKWKKLKVSQLGDQGFKDYQKNIFARGKLLHLNIKNFIQTRDDSALVINDSIEKLWKSLSPVLDLIDGVQLCETPVSHPFLCYKGIVDCVARYSDKLVIIEWKTSEKLKPTLKDIYDNPLQAVAYLGAVNYEASHGLSANEVILVYAYEDGTRAQIHHLSDHQCLDYWNQWLTRLKSYWELFALRSNV